MNYKILIINGLREEADRLIESHEIGRGIALRKSAKIISTYDYIGSSDDLEGIKGIGAGTLRRVKDIIGRGTGGNIEPKTKRVKVEVVDKTVKLMMAGDLSKCKVDVKGWWWSEKYDGIRSYWDGEKLMTKNNNLITAPKFVTERMPTKKVLRGKILDMELFCGRGNFSVSNGIKFTISDTRWELCRFLLIDVIMEGVFETRIKEGMKICKGIKIVKVIRHRKCKGIEMLKKELKKIVNKGGEGIVVREALSRYEGKKVKSMLKYKEMYDAEAIVVGHVEGKGSLHMKTKEGIGFRLSTKLQAVEKYPIGTIITYKYYEIFKSGKPRFPVLMRIRGEE